MNWAAARSPRRHGVIAPRITASVLDQIGGNGPRTGAERTGQGRCVDGPDRHARGCGAFPDPRAHACRAGRERSVPTLVPDRLTYPFFSRAGCVGADQDTVRSNLVERRHARRPSAAGRRRGHREPDFRLLLQRRSVDLATGSPLVRRSDVQSEAEGVADLLRATEVGGMPPQDRRRFRAPCGSHGFHRAGTSRSPLRRPPRSQPVHGGCRRPILTEKTACA